MCLVVSDQYRLVPRLPSGSPGRLLLVHKRIKALCESALQADNWVSRFFPGIRVQKCSSEPTAPIDRPGSGASAPGREASAGEAKVAGTWVNTAEFIKPEVSRPTSKPTGTPKKNRGGERRAKGHSDPIRIHNRFESLEEGAAMEVEASQMSLRSSSFGSSSSIEIIAIIQWNIRDRRANFEELRLFCKHYNPEKVAVQDCRIASYVKIKR